MKKNKNRTPKISDDRRAFAASLGWAYFKFLFFGKFQINSNQGNDEIINRFCKWGGTYRVISKSPWLFEVIRTKSIFYYLFPKNIFCMVSNPTTFTVAFL